MNPVVGIMFDMYRSVEYIYSYIQSCKGENTHIYLLVVWHGFQSQYVSHLEIDIVKF